VKFCGRGVIVAWMWSLLAIGAWAEDDLSVLEERAMQAAAARVAPCVVRVETIGGLERVGKVEAGTGPTSGLIVSSDGYIVASAFNFASKPESILVTIPGRSRESATLVATDLSRQLVLLKVNAPEALPVPEAVPLAEIKVGQWAIALGRAYEDKSPSISVGVISALGRIWSKAIQTDAKISPNNYGGPLVDISGRVFGVLSALGPDMMGGMGSELYDSGIGFAVPLAEIQTVLPRWRSGDLKPGILGISFKSQDQFSQPAEIAAVRVNSPAYKAGVRVGDTIIEAGGRPVVRQAEFKHQLGPLYAGDHLKLVVERGKNHERIDADVQLIDKLPAYEFPFIGILPERPIDGKPEGLLVRYVYPDSPAAKGGLVAGDQIISFAGEKISNAAALVEKLFELGPESKAEIQVRRGAEELKLPLVLGRLPESLPGELPPAHAGERLAAAETPPRGVVPIKLAEFSNECFAFVPDTYRTEIPHGVVIWLGPPGEWKQDALVARWKPLCERYDLILLAPRAADPAEWQRAEGKFIGRAFSELAKSYEIDPARVVVHGHEGGGALAFVIAFANLDQVRGVAVADAPLPSTLSPPETNPVQRLAIYSAQAARGKFKGQAATGIKRLRELKYPVTELSLGDAPRYLNADELSALARWIDTLDRL
jgi:serine protease Do